MEVKSCHLVPDLALCPICHDTIRLSNEAFLERCYHRFCFPCIRKWTETQAERHETTYACPLCKGPYTFVLHDVLDKHSFRRYFVPGDPGTQQGPSDIEYTLDAAQRRRRGLYFAPEGASSTDGKAGIPPGARPTAAGSSRCPRLGPGALRVQQEAWLKRELQALLLQEDVSLVLAHILASAFGGTASAMAKSKPNKRCSDLALTATSSSRSSSTAKHHQSIQLPSSTCNTSMEEAFTSAVVSSSRPFLLNDWQAQLLAAEFARFCASKLSIASYDAQEDLRLSKGRQATGKDIYNNCGESAEAGSRAAAESFDQSPVRDSKRPRHMLNYLSEDEWGQLQTDYDEDDTGPGNFASSCDEW